MPAPQTPYEAVLHAARDVAKLDCALDAEMLGTALLGSVYAVADTDRATDVRRGPQAPPWAAQLGRVRPTGYFAYGDVYGDQTSYLVTFAYDDAAEGGPEHAVVALIDHNIGITKDVFVGGPAERILGQVREMCAADELTWFREEDPGRLRGEVNRHLEITDSLTDLPADGSLATDRALAVSRLAVLPAATVPPLAEP